MKEHPKKDDYGLQALLDLHGFIFFFNRGKHWVKVEAWTVKPTKHIPQGIRYSLTLHDASNTRIVGYDNAHDFLPRRRRHRANVITWDHVHEQEKVYQYEFDTASQLIEDFWGTVIRMIKR
jgi:hypothetical protein